jgi:predicted PurR-regulated permease PerM
MTANALLPPYLRILLTAACMVIVVAGMKAAADILNIFLLSTLLALAILPLPKWLIRKKISKGLSIGITLLLVSFGGLAVFSLFGTSIADLINTLPTYEARMTAMYSDVNRFLAGRGVDITKLLPEDLYSPSHILTWAAAFLSGLAGALSYSVLLIVLAVLILAELAGAPDTPSVGHDATERFLVRLNDNLADVRKYISITGWTGLLVAVADYVLMLAVGIDFAITWAVLAFFLSFIPNIGVLLALVAPAFLAFVGSGWVSAVITVAGFLIISFVVGSLLTPQLMAKGLELRLFLVIGGLVFWTWVLGAPGTIVSVPLTVVIKKVVSAWMNEAPEAG